MDGHHPGVDEKPRFRLRGDLRVQIGFQDFEGLVQILCSRDPSDPLIEQVIPPYIRVRARLRHFQRVQSFDKRRVQGRPARR